MLFSICPYSNSFDSQETPMVGEQEGQEVPFILSSFNLSYLVKGHFPALKTVWF